MPSGVPYGICPSFWLGDDPHSSAHSLVGGMYGCDMFVPLLDENLIEDHTGMMTICGKWAFVMKGK
jgi:hypothetical protein